ncbi:MAG: DUF2313 domain-containing protein [Bacillota bacterium]|nr:DUF2313 domain-containing protein [Bacillota bacterium]
MSELTSARGQVMAGYLPWYYETSRVMQAILQAQGAELDKLRQALDEIRSQFFVSTATWGLDTWEKELGLPVGTGTEAERKSKILSFLRSWGTATIVLVRRAAESFEYGTVDVYEDHSAYTVTLSFVDARGIPLNLDAFQAAMRALIPAHLAIQYQFNFFIWDELDTQSWTWDQLDALGLTWEELEVYA